MANDLKLIIVTMCDYVRVITLFYLTSAVTSRVLTVQNDLELNLHINEHDLSDIEEKWINQPLDNFDLDERRTLKMRYFQNLQLWKPGGPIYVYIAGETELQPVFIANSDILLIYQMAEDTNGALFATEHRYYGKSIPDLPKNNTMQYYQYLSSQQALADLANLIQKLKTDKKFQSSKVVVVGGSYAGNLAVWMRAQYPRLVDAAVAASAPVLAKKDFHEYLDVVRYAFGKYGTANCLENIKNTYKRYEQLLGSKNGIAILKQKFNICPDTDLNQLDNVEFLFSCLYGILTHSAQSGNVTEIKKNCRAYSFNQEIKLDQTDFFSQNTIRRLEDNGKACSNFDFNRYLLEEKKNGAPWSYQYCTEFGYLITTSSEKQPFVHWEPLEFLLKYCKMIVEGDVEKKLDEGVARTNSMYGGLTPNVTKVVFTHGDMDPWRALGVQHDLGPDVPAFTVNGTGHCGIIYAYPGEPEELTTTRKYVKDLVNNWILF